MVHETQRVGLVLPSLGRLNQRGDSQETAVEQVTSPPCLESYLVIRTLLSKTKPDHPKGRRSQVRAGARGTETLCRVGECEFTQPRRGAAWSVVQTCPQNGTARDPETSLLGPHAEETQSLSGKQLATAWSRQPDSQSPGRGHDLEPVEGGRGRARALARPGPGRKCCQHRGRDPRTL